MYDDFMAFVVGDDSYRVARAVVAARGWPEAAVQQGGIDLLADMLETHAPPKMILIDLDREADMIAAAQRTLSLCGPDVRVIFLGALNDINLYRAFVKMGAADYIAKPLTEDMLLQAILLAAKPRAEQSAEKKNASGGRASHIIPVIGTRGGVGASMVALNLAALFSGPIKQHTCLIDLDVQFGASALAFDKEPGRGMRAALENPERLDGLLIASSMVDISPTLSLLCSEEGLDAPLYFNGDASLALIKPVRGDFDVMIIDLPRTILPMQKALLHAAHTCVIVCDFTLPSLRDARRIKAFLKNLKPDLMPLFVGNLQGDGSPSTLDQKTFEKNLESTMDAVLPFDLKTAKLAATMGKPMVQAAPESLFAKNLTTLARMMAGVKEDKKTEKKNADSDVMGALRGLFAVPPKLQGAT